MSPGKKLILESYVSNSASGKADGDFRIMEFRVYRHLGVSTVEDE
jgi:hypothetical protein